MSTSTVIYVEGNIPYNCITLKRTSKTVTNEYFIMTEKKENVINDVLQKSTCIETYKINLLKIFYILINKYSFKTVFFLEICYNTFNFRKILQDPFPLLK